MESENSVHDAGVDLDGDGWVDVTVPVHDGMVHWPGDPEVHVTNVLDLARGDNATVSRLDLGAHTGTHVDAPAHYIAGGKGIDELAFAALLGRARVVSLPGIAAIGREAVDAIAPAAGERILFRTDNSSRCWRDDRFVGDYTSVSLEGARALTARRVRTIGVDYLSVGSPANGAPVHRELLAAGVCIIEGLDLSRVEPGIYDLICLPLRIRHGDGAPARVLVRRRPGG
jgi:arylformamidase